MSARYLFYLNGQPYEVPEPIVRGIEIRAVAGLSPGDALVLEGQGALADQLLRDDSLVSLEHGPVHLFARPPTMFGAS